MRYFPVYCIRVLLLLLWNSFTNSILALPVMPIQHSSVHKKLVGTVTASEIIQYAEMQGSSLSVSTMGPLFRVVARASHNESIILGYCDGAIRPSGAILHLDSMKVFKPSLVKAAATDDGFQRGGGTVFGIGLLLGCLCLRHGLDSGCRTVEFLAIDDEDHQHSRLVRHYKRLGLQVVRYVGDDFRSIPDRLIWGGRGTLMNGDISTVLRKWTPTFIPSSSQEEAEIQQAYDHTTTICSRMVSRLAVLEYCWHGNTNNLLVKNDYVLVGALIALIHRCIPLT